MATVSVYYCKGDIREELVASVFSNKAFDINEATPSSDKAGCDSKLRDVLSVAAGEQGWTTFVFLKKLDEKGRVQAAKFANDVLASGDDKTLLVEDPDFSAIAIPRAQAERIQAALEKGGSIFEAPGYSPMTGACAVVNRNLLFVLIMIAITILIMLSHRVKTKTGLYLLVGAFVFIVFFAIAFSA